MIFAASYVIIATLLSLQCSQPLYIPLHFSFSSFQRRFIKRAGRKRFFQKQPFSRLPISEIVEMIALTLLKAILNVLCATCGR